MFFFRTCTYMGCCLVMLGVAQADAHGFDPVLELSKLRDEERRHQFIVEALGDRYDTTTNAAEANANAYHRHCSDSVVQVSDAYCEVMAARQYALVVTSVATLANLFDVERDHTASRASRFEGLTGWACGPVGDRESRALQREVAVELDAMWRLEMAYSLPELVDIDGNVCLETPMLAHMQRVRESTYDRIARSLRLVMQHEIPLSGMLWEDLLVVPDVPEEGGGH